jgi:hypothetical protein
VEPVAGLRIFPNKNPLLICHGHSDVVGAGEMKSFFSFQRYFKENLKNIQ